METTNAARLALPMSAHAWRRHHGPGVLAEIFADGRGAWGARAWLTSNPTVRVSSPRDLDTVASAQDKADLLARKTFDHRCSGVCGYWTWESVVEHTS